MRLPTAELPDIHPGYGTGKAPPGEQLPWSVVDGWIAESRNYWVCTVRADGRPHAIPVWGVWDGEALVFGTNPESVKGRNIARDPRVVVHLESGDEVAILEGAIEPFSGDGARWSAAYEAKYAIAQEVGAGWHMLRPSVVLSWREADYPSTATRWRF